MPRYYCDYCDAYLTHDSALVRKQHNAGFKHKSNVKAYYLQYEEEAQVRLWAELNGFAPPPGGPFPPGMMVRPPPGMGQGPPPPSHGGVRPPMYPPSVGGPGPMQQPPPHQQQQQQYQAPHQ
ncbi:U1 small nuclear ribonucleoprotein C [Picochlorum sp. SENEW3]|nr:U1 small nuclear ribonucleoprotein C [Picochlorum sp. SENEW3]